MNYRDKTKEELSKKIAEEELKTSHSLLNEIIEGTNDAFFVKDIEGRYIMINSFGSKILDKPKEEIVGKNDMEILPHEVANTIMKDDHNIIETGESRTYEETILSGENCYIFLTTKSPYRDHRGNIIGVIGIARNITELKQAEEKLLKAHHELEQRVRERTLELQEKNIALKVLLTQREDDKNDLEQNILSNVKSLIQPYISKLKKNNLNLEDVSYLNIIESNLEDIISPFSKKLSSNYMMFTSKEIEIANLIKEGKKDKEIMEIMNIAFDTVKGHRKNIRKKLGIHGKGTNLRNKLLSI